MVRAKPATTATKARVLLADAKFHRTEPLSNHADFARRLHRALTDKNMTPSELAAAVWGRREALVNGRVCSVAANRERVSIYLSGRGLPRPESLRKIAEVLGTTPEKLAPGVGASKLPPDLAIELVEGGRFASLRINTVLPADVALEIAALVNRAHEAPSG